MRGRGGGRALCVPFQAQCENNLIVKTWTGITQEISGLGLWPMTLRQLVRSWQKKESVRKIKQTKKHHFNLIIIIKKLKYQHHSATASLPEELRMSWTLMWLSLCSCPESQQESGGVGAHSGRGGGLSQQWFYLDEPPLLCCDRRDTEELNLFVGCFLFHLRIRCKQVHPFQGSQQPVRWTEQEGKRKETKQKIKIIQSWRLVLVERGCWPGGTRAGQGSNCGVGCTFHSALFQAGSWMCSGGRTTWRRRRRGPRGRPWPHNPGSWRAVRQRYLEVPETGFIWSSLT